MDKYNEEWAWYLASEVTGLKSNAPPQPSHDMCENVGLLMAQWEFKAGETKPADGVAAFRDRVARFKANRDLEFDIANKKNRE
jgi:hypothetical protein